VKAFNDVLMICTLGKVELRSFREFSSGTGIVVFRPGVGFSKVIANVML
jgi:hypothetical protein